MLDDDDDGGGSGDEDNDMIALSLSLLVLQQKSVFCEITELTRSLIVRID